MNSCVIFYEINDKEVNHSKSKQIQGSRLKNNDCSQGQGGGGGTTCLEFGKVCVWQNQKVDPQPVQNFSLKNTKNL